MTQTPNNQRWILVAEDDDEIRGLISRALSNESLDTGLPVSVVEAKDGQDALLKVNAREFHCVVTDILMPKSSGIDLLRTMQSSALNANTPKVVVTAAELDQTKHIAGLIRIVAKPFDVSELAKTVFREIKMGRMDDRIASYLVNPFMQAIQTVLARDTGLSYKTEPPFVSKPGEALQGDLHCNLVISAGQTRGRFTLSYDASLLQELRTSYFKTRNAQWANMPPENMAKQLCQNLLDEALPAIKKQMGDLARVGGTSIFTKNTEPENGDMTRTNGIGIVVATDHGRIIAGAFAKPKPRRV